MSAQKTEAASIEPEIIEPRIAPRVITAENAFIMTSIMQDVVKHGTARRALALKRNDLAGKTGTTNEFRDAWFSGFNGNIVTTAWVGFDQPSSLGRHESGAKAALPIWIDYMRVALKGSEETELKQPDNVFALMVDPETGNYVGPVPEEVDSEATSGLEEVSEETASEEETAQEETVTDPDAPEKPEPIKEYFIAGTEPKGVVTISGDDPDADTSSPPTPPAADGGLEGLF